MSLGIYVHIPFCTSKCFYCDFVSSVEDEVTQKIYIKKLVDEIKQFNKTDQKVDTIYFGGGTPTCLYQGALYEIMSQLHEKFDILKNAEISIESNPDKINDSKISEFKECGINRISIGLQVANDKLLKSLNRSHLVSDYVRAMKKLRVNFNNINTDLIIGIQGQTKNDLINSIDLIKTFWSEHISIYALTLSENTVLYRNGFVPDEDFIADLYQIALENIKPIFHRYEVSNFARENKECEHNKKYWNINCDYVGFGVAAHSKLQNIRYKNVDNLSKYLTSNLVEKNILSKKDIINESIMLGLRTSEGINLSYLKKIGYDLLLNKNNYVCKLLESDIINIKNNKLKISEDYFYLINQVIINLML